MDGTEKFKLASTPSSTGLSRIQHFDTKTMNFEFINIRRYIHTAFFIMESLMLHFNTTPGKVAYSPQVRDEKTMGCNFEMG
jgi:hypothetical protein